MTASLTQISGIGPSTAKVLIDNGFKSAEQLAGTTTALLGKVPGFAAARASRTINAAKEFLAAADDVSTKAIQTTKRPRRVAQKPAPESTKSTSIPATGNKDNTDTQENDMKKKTKKEQEKLEKTKAKKAAAKLAAAKKAAAKKAAAKKAATKKAAAKKAKAKKAKAKKAKAKKSKK